MKIVELNRAVLTGLHLFDMMKSADLLCGIRVFCFFKMFRTFVRKTLKNFGQSLQIGFPSCATNKLN